MTKSPSALTKPHVIDPVEVEASLLEGAVDTSLTAIPVAGFTTPTATQLSGLTSLNGGAVSLRAMRSFNWASIWDSLCVERVGEDGFSYFTRVGFDEYSQLLYESGLEETSEAKLRSSYRFVSAKALSLDHLSHLVRFGSSADSWVVWDMRAVRFLSPNECDPTTVIWRVPFAPLTTVTAPLEYEPFLLSLAGGDRFHYQDLLQTISPLFLEKKPTGVVWWVGSGRNGKSALVNALYKCFPGQLAGLTLKQITDERDLPLLNGSFANITRESSEGYVEDTRNYKAIGTHEDFYVHKFHSQDPILIKGNLHHIHNANAVPQFNDKGLSGRRRTVVVPFNETFPDDPSFEGRTFTPQMLSLLLTEALRMAVTLKSRNYQYQFSATTIAAKEYVDTLANSAEEYLRERIQEGLVAFDSYVPLSSDYQNWCLMNGVTALGTTNLQRAARSMGFERQAVRVEGIPAQKYYLKSVDHTMIELAPLTHTTPLLYRDASIPVSYQAPSTAKTTQLAFGGGGLTKQDLEDLDVFMSHPDSPGGTS